MLLEISENLGVDKCVTLFDILYNHTNVLMLGR